MRNDTTCQESNYLLSDYCVAGPVRGVGHTEMKKTTCCSVFNEEYI